MTPRSENLDTAYKRVVTAALDQPRPTPELTAALNHLLDLTQHPVRSRVWVRGKSVRREATA